MTHDSFGIQNGKKKNVVAEMTKTINVSNRLTKHTFFSFYIFVLLFLKITVTDIAVRLRVIQKNDLVAIN